MITNMIMLTRLNKNVNNFLLEKNVNKLLLLDENINNFLFDLNINMFLWTKTPNFISFKGKI